MIGIFLNFNHSTIHRKKKIYIKLLEYTTLPNPHTLFITIKFKFIIQSIFNKIIKIKNKLSKKKINQ